MWDFIIQHPQLCDSPSLLALRSGCLVSAAILLLTILLPGLAASLSQSLCLSPFSSRDVWGHCRVACITSVQS